ncbi:helix-turn-helix domain-containing protein [Methanolobus zinderi]|uniref:Helix-turn-helix domain-containing protein n=1 Tax=Methanolobus zinderi TaxID=536044 RepID=A0A7D5ICM4_9EURY|nr:helix-turn-helix domain-containing protein [Methanolobus zinderi]QLC50869.1 helix-turn-helix domain-containing protein [Methanolobus zinderi]
MKTTCEIMVQRVLPAIRAEIARVIISEHGRSQQEAAEVLGLSRAAVSQYLSEKRGAEVNFSEDTYKEIRNFTFELLAGMSPKDEVAGMCNICKYVQKSGWLNRNEPDAEQCILCGEPESN